MGGGGEVESMRIAIIGAGITGALIAHGLKKTGYSVTLYDKEDYLGERAREWTMGIHWAFHIFQELLPEDIYNDLPSVFTNRFHNFDDPEDKIPMINGMTGELIVALPAGPIRRVSRTKMRRLLTRGLDIEWSKSFVGCTMHPDDGAVTISFEDGSTAIADLVIGADGSNSPVRKWLLGPEAGSTVSSDIVLFNGIVRYEDAEAARKAMKHPLAALIYYDSGVWFSGVHDIKDKDDPKTWSFHYSVAWEGQLLRVEDAEAVKALKEQLKGLEPSFQSDIDSIPDDSPSMMGQLHYWTSQQWDNKKSRVTLAGDAAHSMFIFRGQGLNNAMQDAENLVEQLTRVKKGERSLPQAIEAYEAEVVERGAKAVKQSIKDAEDALRFPQIFQSRMVKTGFMDGAKGAK